MTKISTLKKGELNQVQKLEDKLEKFKVKLEKVDYINDKEEFFKLMHKFWEFISNFDDQKTYEIFKHTDYFYNNKSIFAALENYYVRTIEAVEALSIITKQLTTNTNFFNLFERRIAKETYLQTNLEMKLVDFTNCKNLVMVGCGPLPETMLYIFENTPITKIIGLDRNQEAIYMAGEMIRTTKWSPRIKLMHYDGIKYNYKDADIIYVANFVSPKTKILNRIAKTCKPNAQIIVRTPVLLGEMLYEKALVGLDSRFTIKKEGEVNKYFLWKPLVLKKLSL